MTQQKTCPECAETIQAEAKVCRYCGQRFGTPASQLGKAALVGVLLFALIVLVAYLINDMNAAQETGDQIDALIDSAP